MKTMQLVRNLILITLILLTVVSAKDALVNALFSVSVGVWVMVKLFKHIYNIVQNSSDITEQEFLSYSFRKYIGLGLLFPGIRKQAFGALVWWGAGILTGIATYYILKVLLLS